MHGGIRPAHPSHLAYPPHPVHPLTRMDIVNINCGSYTSTTLWWVLLFYILYIDNLINVAKFMSWAYYTKLKISLKINKMILISFAIHISIYTYINGLKLIYVKVATRITRKSCTFHFNSLQFSDILNIHSPRRVLFNKLQLIMYTPM